MDLKVRADICDDLKALERKQSDGGDEGSGVTEIPLLTSIVASESTSSDLDQCVTCVSSDRSLSWDRDGWQFELFLALTVESNPVCVERPPTALKTTINLDQDELVLY